MVIKQISRSGDAKPLLTYLLRYIAREGKLVPKEGSKCKLLWSHNLMSRSIKGYVAEFRGNAALRKHKRSPVISHVILSFHPLDTAKLTDSILVAICKEYVRVRGQTSQYLFALHKDTLAVHIHCAQSINTVSGRSNRISQKQFADLKLQLNEFQLKFDLSHSLPCHGKKRQKAINTLKLQSYYKEIQKQKEEHVKQFKAIREKAKGHSLEKNSFELERKLGSQKFNRSSSRPSDETFPFPSQQFTWGLGLSP